MIKLFDSRQIPKVYDAVKAVLESGRFVKGGRVEEFEEVWAARCNKKYAAGVSSGATALELAISATNQLYGEGLMVTYTPHTFIAVRNAIERNNLIAVPEQDHPNIFAHHLHNEVIEYPTYKAVIEDCSHCHGYQPKAPTAIFSFYPTKILGACGDAGIIVTDDEAVAALVKRKRSHGYRGTNARMDEVQAAILLAKLPYLNRWIERRREIVALYDKELHRQTPGEYHYAYCIPGSEEKKQKLIEQGIESAFYYTPEYMALPLHHYLTNDEVEEVVEAVRKL